VEFHDFLQENHEVNILIIMLILSKAKPIFFISFSALLSITLFLVWLNSNSASHVRADLRHLLSNELIRINPPAPGTKVDVIYVLGGSQTSLGYRYKTVADLFHKGICKRIWILSRPGKTEDSPSLGRNLTNDEWSVLKLNEFGVPKEYISPIKAKERFFGTFSEAKDISSLIKRRGYKSLVLVSSPYHTHRVKISFDNFLKNTNTSIFACPVKSGFYLTGVQGSEGKAFLRDLIVEFLKLKVYQYFLV
jgi:uncharacterized SAM-binding protein YcdF (DUF218 family)